MLIKDLIEQEIRNGLSRRELARQVRVSLGTVQNILLGDTETKNSTLEKFSHYFKTKAERPATSIPDSNLAREHIKCLNELLKAKDRIHELEMTLANIRAPIPEQEPDKIKRDGTNT